MGTRRKKPAPASVGLEATEVADGAPPPEIATLAEEVEDDGGTVLASYREPFGGNWVLLVSLPIDLVEATPFQRELSEAHADRLANSTRAGSVPSRSRRWAGALQRRSDQGVAAEASAGFSP